MTKRDLLTSQNQFRSSPKVAVSLERYKFPHVFLTVHMVSVAHLYIYWHSKFEAFNPEANTTLSISSS